jgi:tRNA(fMet)-specific endonuclease VapC
VERLIVDTGVLVALERGRAMSANAIPDDADIAVAAITASELLVGVELADARRVARRRAMVEGVLGLFEVLPFDLAAARHHAALLAHAHRDGRPRGAHDLLIAATARASSRVVLTTDRTAFVDLPAVTHRVVGSGA